MNKLTAISVETIRQRSIEKLISMGVEPTAHLPFSDWPTELRSIDQIVDRSTAICLCVAKANDVQIDYLEWARANNQLANLHERERLFLGSSMPSFDEANFYRAQEEALWVLCWAIGIVKKVQLDKTCDTTLARVSPGPFRADEIDATKLSVRSAEEILQLDDALYLMDNSIVGQHLQGRKNDSRLLPHFVVRHRRHATQWLLGSDDYYDVSLDT
jgi:hypothetical protein